MQSFAAAGEVTAVVLPVSFVACLAAEMMMIYVGQLFLFCFKMGLYTFWFYWLLAAIATNMLDILAYAALILSMSQRDYHIFRISNVRTYQPG